jgi:hypothetical protein
MDFETIESPIDGTQIPVAISLAYNFKEDITTKFLLTDVGLISNLETQDEAIKKLFKELFKVLLEIKVKDVIIFTHNLGGFDGLFLFKYLSIMLDKGKVNTIIDQHHKFILIEAELAENRVFKWKDSYRIFPVSLNDLCKNFEMPGKSSEYNQLFNKIDFFINNNENTHLFSEFKKYSIQDSVALLNCLLEAQKLLRFMLCFSFYITNHSGYLIP